MNGKVELMNGKWKIIFLKKTSNKNNKNNNTCKHAEQIKNLM